MGGCSPQTAHPLPFQGSLIKYILGVGDLLTGQLLTYDAIKQEFHKIKLPWNGKGCAVCGEHPTITELIDYEQAECTDK